MSVGSVYLQDRFVTIEAEATWYQEKNLAQEVPTLQAGQILGKGAFSTVVKVSCLGRDWAVKKTICRSEAKFISKEADVLRMLNEKEKAENQEHVVQAIALLLLKGNPMLVMKFYRGGDLLTRVSQMNGGLSFTSTLTIAKHLLGALVFLKEAKIIHRDLKLANIFYEEGDEVKLGDFGLSMNEGDEQELSIFCGTPKVMSPELLKAYKDTARIYPYGSSSDVWAVGCVLFKVFSGSQLFPDDEIADWVPRLQSQQTELSSGLEPLLYRISQKKYISPRELPFFSKALKGMLELDPAKRITPEEAMSVLSGQEPFVMVEKQDLPFEDKVQDTQEERDSFVWIERAQAGESADPIQNNKTAITVIFDFFQFVANGASRWLRG